MASPTSALAGRVVAEARVRTLSFAALFAVGVWANAWGYTTSFPTAADRIRLVATFADNPAARIFYGAGRNLATVGGYTAWRAGGILAVFAAVFGIFAAARPMRGDEELGRAELVLAGALTRTSALTAILTGIGVTLGVAWIGLVLGGVLGGLPAGGSAALALTVTSVACVYAAVGAVTNQLVPTRRGALGLSGAVLGVDLALRVVADTTDHFGLHWFSPLGWAEEVHALAGTRPVVWLVPLGATIGLIVVAMVLHARRDLGGAYVKGSDSSSPRTGLLGSPTAFAVRLDRVTIAVWVTAIAAFAFIIGTVADTVKELELSQELRDQIAKVGGIDFTSAEGYVGLTFLIFVFAIAFFVCAQLAAIHDDESNHRVETLFAQPYARLHWLGGRVALITGATIGCALAAGAGVGLGVAVVGGDLAFGRSLAAGINVMPAEVLFLGLGVLFFGLFPRHAVGVLYGVVAGSFVWELFGALLDAPAWTLDLSPFHHVAPVPAKPMAVASALVMIAIGIAAGGIGAWRFRARDLAGE